MAGGFVPNITIGPMVVETVRRSTQKPLNVHLMIVEPDRYLVALAKAGADPPSRPGRAVRFQVTRPTAAPTCLKAPAAGRLAAVVSPVPN
jgi:hypothetical protein